ncbi:zinc-finger domain-containing protein [Ferrovibrio sp.]|uniref:zinc-finger domain-containing protein n=1 Tax=Ferrovibrio sp. TaxID=1917215 RepID=UPI000CCB32D6|nr:zinc-finger domain-containing protein [Ferrovibrio sp.]PJI42165.1 MAG: zinc-finger domain-containing protein [Ferrovibrio sp.]
MQATKNTAPETITVESPVVACDGGGGALGHPRVYLNMGDKTEIDCPYCGRAYLLKDGAGHHGH